MAQLEQAAAMAQQYQQANPQPNSNTQGGNNADDNVVDADFTEKK